MFAAAAREEHRRKTVHERPRRRLLRHAQRSATTWGCAQAQGPTSPSIRSVTPREVAEDDRRVPASGPRLIGLSKLKILTFGPRPYRLPRLQRADPAPCSTWASRSRRTPSSTSTPRTIEKHDGRRRASRANRGRRTWSRGAGLAATLCPSILPEAGAVRAHAARLGGRPTRAPRVRGIFANKCWPALRPKFKLRALLREQPPDRPRHPGQPARVDIYGAL